MEFFDGGGFADVGGPFLGGDAAVGFEDVPPFFGGEGEVVYEEAASWLEDAAGFEDVVVAVPFVEVHEDYGAVDEIDACVGDGGEVVTGYFDVLDVLECFESVFGVGEHVGADVAADPLAALGGEGHADASDAGSDFEDDVFGAYGDGIFYAGDGIGGFATDGFFVYRADDMGDGVFEAVGELGPDLFVFVALGAEALFGVLGLAFEGFVFVDQLLDFGLEGGYLL